MKRMFITLVVSLVCLFAVPAVASASFSPFKTVCSNGGGSSAVCTDSKTQSSSGADPLQSKIASATHFVAFIAGIAAIIMIVVGAIKYVTSGGDSNATGSAKNTLIAATVGLVIIVLAQSIIVYVVDRI